MLVAPSHFHFFQFKKIIIITLFVRISTIYDPTAILEVGARHKRIMSKLISYSLEYGEEK